MTIHATGTYKPFLLAPRACNGKPDPHFTFVTPEMLRQHAEKAICRLRALGEQYLARLKESAHAPTIAPQKAVVPRFSRMFLGLPEFEVPFPPLPQPAVPAAPQPRVSPLQGIPEFKVTIRPWKRS